MSSTAGFIIGMFVGGLVVFVMMSVIITASRADEKERRLFEEYLKEKPFQLTDELFRLVSADLSAHPGLRRTGLVRTLHVHELRAVL